MTGKIEEYRDVDIAILSIKARGKFKGNLYRYIRKDITIIHTGKGNCIIRICDTEGLARGL